MPELPQWAQVETPLVPAIWALARKWNLFLSVKQKLVLGDIVIFIAAVASKNFFQI